MTSIDETNGLTLKKKLMTNDSAQNTNVGVTYRQKAGIRKPAIVMATIGAEGKLLKTIAISVLK